MIDINLKNSIDFYPSKVKKPSKQLFIVKSDIMLNGFYNETKPLTDYEERTLLPVMVKCLSKHIGEEKAITNKKMCEALQENGYEVGEARIRKLINHIRINGLVDYLVANSKGYFVAQKKDEVKSHIASLKGREEAINAVRMALEEQLEGMKENES